MKKENVWLWALCFLSVPVLAQTPVGLKEQVEAVIVELSSPDEWGTTLFPAATKLHRIKTEKTRIQIFLDFPNDFVAENFEAESHEEVIEHFAVALTEFKFKEINVLAAKEKSNYIPLSEFILQNPIASAANASNSDPMAAKRLNPTVKFPRLDKEVQAKGILSGKTVWLSAGHGWQYDSRKRCFKTQRHNNHSVVEDFASIESVNYYLLKYLYNAGANVWTVRERDMNPNEIIIDNDQKSPYYKESGRWTTSKTKGYKGSNYRYAISSKKSTATASYHPNIKEDGLYWVSVYYKSGWNRAADVRYHVFHAGGESIVRINQEVHGDTWVYLGQFYFEKGQQSKVVISNASVETKQAIVADAVRFGGGVGSVADCRHGKESGEPRFEEAAKYYAVFQGYPICDNDVMIRPNYAEWELAKGTKEEQENAVYISWHTNGGKGKGTETFTHAYNPIKGSWSLQKYIHEALIQDIRSAWDANWVDRGRKAADFGELRGLRKMPGVLLEIAFHDNPLEAKALNTPAFREIAARAVYKGIVKYFAAKDRRHPVYAPEKPTEIFASNRSRGKVRLKWKTPKHGGVYGHKARAYKIYLSTNGKGFIPVASTKKTEYTFDNLEAGRLYYFRITGINSGGESFPSSVLALRTPNKGVPLDEKFLIVDGFDRLDRGLARLENERLPRFAPLGKIRRLFLEEMNNYDYAVHHAQAMANWNFPFDGATNEAVVNRSLQLKDYKLVNWFLGRESEDTEVLNKQERKLIKDYLNGAGNLIISGSEIAYHLGKKKGDSKFLAQYLKSTYKGDDARSSKVMGKPATNFKNLAAHFTHSNCMHSPDVIQATEGAETVMYYGNRKTAAVGYKGDYKLLYFAFPLEKIADTKLRTKFFAESFDYMDIDPMPAQGQAIATVPQKLKESLVLNLKNIPEGKASFRLLDESGKAVFQKSWAHRPNQKKNINLPVLSSERYRYELEILGQVQKGFVFME